MTGVLVLLAALLVLIVLRPATAIGDCCCGAGGGGGAVCCVVCRLFSTLAREYTLTVAGITDGTFCENCEEFNGTFTMHWRNAGIFETTIGENCSWNDYYPDGEPCFDPDGPRNICTHHYRWTMGIVEDPPDVFTFRLAPGTTFSTVVYELAATSWNCTGSNVMTRTILQEGICNNFPATVTVTAGSGRVAFCECYPPYNAFASRWSVAFSNIKGCCSPEINDTHLLTPYSCLSCGQCTWNRLISADCPGEGNLWLFLEYGSTRTTLYIWNGTTLLRNAHALYLMKNTDFNPVGPNVLNRVDLSPSCDGQPLTGDCTGWPAQVTIFPA